MPPAPAPESTHVQVSRLQAFLGGQQAPQPPPRPPTGSGAPQPVRQQNPNLNGPPYLSAPPPPIRRESDLKTKTQADQVALNLLAPSAASAMGGGGGQGHGAGHSSSSGYSVTCILFTGIIFVVAVFVTIAALVNSLHRVKEGNVAVYFSNGALLEDITGPGVHWSTPFVTTVHQIMVRPETYYLNPMECTTSDGVVNVFREIAVISSLEREKVRNLVQTFGVDIKQVLLYDRVTEGIQAFCANHSIDEVFNTKFINLRESVQVYLNVSISRFAKDGITVWNLHIPKPQIPPAIAANYREVKIEWTKQLVAQQKQKTERIKKETALQNAKLDAQRVKDVSLIQMQEKLEKEKSQAEVSDVKNTMLTKAKQAQADAEAYMATSRAQYNQQLLTDQYIKLQMAKSMMNNTKVFFSGQDSTLGSLISKLFT